MERLIQFKLTEDEKNCFLNYNYEAGSKSGNRSIGKYIIKSLEEGVMVKGGREAFTAQKFKNKVISDIWSNGRLGKKTKELAASNYGHYIIMNRIYWFMYIERKYQEKLAIGQ